MNPFVTAGAYLRWARNLSRYTRRPLALVAARLVLGRLLFARGPVEFDEYGFATKPVRRWRRYLDDPLRIRIQEAAAPACHRALDEDKVTFWLTCRDAGLPVIPVTAVLAPGPGASFPDVVRRADTGRDLEEILGGMPAFDGFAKPTRGGQGYGAFPFRVEAGVVTSPSGSAAIADFFDDCVRRGREHGGYVLQPRARAHPALLPVMPGPGLGALRIASFRAPDGDVAMPWAVLKIPGPGQVISNRRPGALIAAVDVATGRITTPMGATRDVPVVHPVPMHPETGARFDEIQVPGWDEIRALVVRAAEVFRDLPCLGWDIAVTPDGPLLIETNWKFGLNAEQTLYGGGLRDEFLRRYAQCAGVPDRAAR